MENYTKLSETLSTKIDRIIQSYEHLKSENEMLREELKSFKERLQKKESELLEYSGNADIKEVEITNIIEKLEKALGTYESGYYKNKT